MTPSRAGLRAGASTVGALPRRYRHAAGLTQEALAAWAGQSRRGLQHLEASEALPERALHLPGAAAAMRDAIGSPRKPAEGARLDRGLAAARVALEGLDTAEAAWQRRRRMSADEAVDTALAAP